MYILDSLFFKVDQNKPLILISRIKEIFNKRPLHEIGAKEK